jgi:DNA-binding transcriptional regulator LsrR (DeoR family)
MKSKFEELARLVQSKEDLPQGKGWMTFHEFRDEIKNQGLSISESKARLMIKEGVKNGLVEIYKGTRESESGVLQQKIWYRFTK